MHLKEIGECISAGISLLSFGAASYLITLRWINFTHRFSQSIRSQEELEKIVDEEAQALGLDSSKIISRYNAKPEGAWKDGDCYYLQLSGDRVSTNRSGVRHELYHIKKKDCDRFENRDVPHLYYLLISEPRALLYGSFKIKI